MPVSPAQPSSVYKPDKFVGLLPAGQAGTATSFVGAYLFDASNGLPVSIMRVIASSAVAIPHTGTTGETVLATVSIPAGAIGANGFLRVTVLWGFDTSANNKIGRVKFGAAGGGTAGTAYFSTGNTTTNLTYRAEVQIGNRGAANSQVGNAAAIGGFGVTSGAVVTSSVDTSAAAEIAFTASLASAGDAMRLESYLVEVFPSV